ncbi:MAG: acylphosphatase [Sphingobacteriales bacterium]|nr:acylphosphatase [Sphingobacteriales bacterium]
MQQTLTIIVYGKVQGVFFRKYAREKAMELGLTGEIKNNPDGSVFIAATGTSEQHTVFCDWCRTGPPTARVTEVVINHAPLQAFESFRIVR